MSKLYFHKVAGIDWFLNDAKVVVCLDTLSGFNDAGYDTRHLLNKLLWLSTQVQQNLGRRPLLSGRPRNSATLSLINLMRYN